VSGSSPTNVARVEIRALVARHLPGRDVGSVIVLGQGADNVAYQVDGELVVRVSKDDDPRRRGEAVQREADLLSVVAEFSTLPVPTVVFVDVAEGAFAYRKVLGLPLATHPVAEPGRLAPALGEFVSGLHGAPVTRMAELVEPDAEPLRAWLDEAQEDYRAVAAVIPAAQRRAVEGFLARTPPPEPTELAFCHNDLGTEHLLVDAGTGALSGVIDWTDAAIADPAVDLALIYRDLGPDVFDLTVTHYNGHCDAAARDRAAFYARCALLEDVAYGVTTTSRRSYADAALTHLPRTFA
jgi:aminoglycoside phosphotransferase (APT) family kinase protein